MELIKRLAGMELIKRFLKSRICTDPRHRKNTQTHRFSFG